MSNVLGSWSGMRKYLEHEMLTECMQGRVRYNCTSYAGMDGWGLFEVYIDDILIKRFSLDVVNTYFIKNGYKENSEPYGLEEYWKDFRDVLDAVPLKSRTEYTDAEFSDALGHYRNQSIQESINSENPIVRMFAILDRRVGKRTLTALKEKALDFPQWLYGIYETRMEAEFA